MRDSISSSASVQPAAGAAAPLERLVSGMTGSLLRSGCLAVG